MVKVIDEVHTPALGERVTEVSEPQAVEAATVDPTRPFPDMEKERKFAPARVTNPKPPAVAPLTGPALLI